MLALGIDLSAGDYDSLEVATFNVDLALNAVFFEGGASRKIVTARLLLDNE